MALVDGERSDGLEGADAVGAQRGEGEKGREAEENVKAKSMRVFIDNNPHLKGIRLSMKNYENQSWIENIPLFSFREYLNRRV